MVIYGLILAIYFNVVTNYFSALFATDKIGDGHMSLDKKRVTMALLSRIYYQTYHTVLQLLTHHGYRILKFL